MLSGLDRIIVDLTLILISAGVTTVIFRRIKQPVVLGYIVVGFLTGTNFHWFPNVSDLADIHVWADIGIVFLMFGLGLEFSLQQLTKLGGSVVVTTLTVVTVMVVIGFDLGQLMGWGKMDSIFLGGMISLSSTMIVLKAYEEYDLKDKPFAPLVFGVLILEDVVGVFLMIILTTLSVSRQLSGLDMLVQISKLLSYLILWLALGIYLIPSALKRAKSYMNDESLLIASVGLCLGMVVIANALGFSSALGAFIAGSILAGTVLAERIDSLVKPVKDLFGAVFFVSVGMMVVPDMILKYLGPILLITAAVVIGQMLFSGIGTLLSGHSLHAAVRVGSSFVQIGEISFIIATLGMNLKVTSDFLYPVVVCVCVLTTFITPIMIRNAERAYELLCRILPDRTVSFLNRYTSDKRSDVDKDEDWSLYISRYFKRTTVCTASLVVIYMVSVKFINPFVYNGISSDPIGKILEIILVLILMSPFISIMCSGRRQFLFAKLWLKNTTNRLPLLALNGVRVALSVFFVTLTLRTAYPIPLWILLLIALAVIYLVEKSDFIKSATLIIETRFVENYNERTLEKSRKEHHIKGKHNWLYERMYVIRFSVLKVPKKDNVSEFFSIKPFGICIDRVVREDGEILDMPHATDKIMLGDCVFAMGTEQQVEQYTAILGEIGHIAYDGAPAVTLKEFIQDQKHSGVKEEDHIICCAIEIPKKSPLSRKTVKHSNFRAKYNGYIIGIERDLTPISNIRKNTLIHEKDLLWVMGKGDMVDKLISDGLLV